MDFLKRKITNDGGMERRKNYLKMLILALYLYSRELNTVDSTEKVGFQGALSLI